MNRQRIPAMSFDGKKSRTFSQLLPIKSSGRWHVAKFYVIVFLMDTGYEVFLRCPENEIWSLERTFFGLAAIWHGPAEPVLSACQSGCHSGWVIARWFNNKGGTRVAIVSGLVTSGLGLMVSNLPAWPGKSPYLSEGDFRWWKLMTWTRNISDPSCLFKMIYKYDVRSHFLQLKLIWSFCGDLENCNWVIHVHVYLTQTPY
jgi:hypothetical protein